MNTEPNKTSATLERERDILRAEVEDLRRELDEERLLNKALQANLNDIRQGQNKEQDVCVDLMRERDEVIAENDRLRAALSNSDQPCLYCSLPASEMSKCPDGFPGCSRADDAVGCPHFGAALGIMDLEKVLEDPERSRVAFESAWKSGCEIDPQSGDYVELAHSTGWTHWCRALEYVKTLIK